MSSSLSPLPSSPTLPPLLNNSQPTLSSFGISRSSPKAPSLPKTTSYLIVQGLYRCTLLLTIPASVQYSCSQPNCQYSYTYLSTKITSTGNLSRHYNSYYKGILTTEQDAIQRQRAKDNSQFFSKNGHNKVLT